MDDKKISELNELLRQLSNGTCLGNINTLKGVIKSYLPNADIKTVNENVYFNIKGNGNKTLMLDAHLDQIGFVVTDVCGEFLKVSFMGGIDDRTLATKRVTVFGKNKYEISGVFCSTPPHLKEKESKTECFIDTGIKNAAEYISVGDFAAFKEPYINLKNNFVCGQSLDNRAGVAAVLFAVKHAKSFKDNILVLLSNQEELGLRGAKTFGFLNTPDEAITVDVSFGNQHGISNHILAKLNSGALIGVSPILNKNLTSSLLETAKTNKIKYTFEVMNGKTGTNADVLSVTKNGIKTALISIPLRNMHTAAEVVCLNDILAVSDIIKNYIEY